MIVKGHLKSAPFRGKRSGGRTIKGGVQSWTGIPKPGRDKILSDIEAKSCRIFELSRNGKYLACCGSKGVKIWNMSDWKIILDVPLGQIAGAKFSPSDNFISLWEPYAVTTEHPQGFDNLRIYKISCGSLVKAYVQKRNVGWEPTWSPDDQLMARNLNGDVHFFEKENFARITHKIEGQKIRSVSIAPGPSPYHVLCYTPGFKGQPSFSRIFRFPNLENTNAVASRSFFQGEDIEIRWNKTGKEVLIMASTEVDKSGASYYGKNALFYLDNKGNSAVVQLDKQGPIYAHEFTPDGKGFCVVYGFMPSVCKLFDLKCNVIRDFGPGHRNSIYYNPHGNLLMLGGFGNISGKMEIWDVKRHKQIFKAEIPDVTYLCWAADGEHFITGTTAPRLRVNNGFKIWHYTGSLQYEFKVEEGDELYQVALQPIPEGIFPEKEIVTEQVPGIEYATKQDSKKAYIPPSARNRPASDLSTRTQFGVYTKSSHLPPGLAMPAQPIAAAGKKKKKASRNLEDQDIEKSVKTGPQPSLNADVKPVPEILKNDVERNKRISSLNKKLDQIVKLKEQVAAGKNLELNQLQKIQKEEEIIKELKTLSLT